MSTYLLRAKENVEFAIRICIRVVELLELRTEQLETLAKLTAILSNIGRVAQQLDRNQTKEVLSVSHFFQKVTDILLPSPGDVDQILCGFTLRVSSIPTMPIFKLMNWIQTQRLLDF